MTPRQRTYEKASKQYFTSLIREHENDQLRKASWNIELQQIDSRPEQTSKASLRSKRSQLASHLSDLVKPASSQQQISKLSEAERLNLQPATSQANNSEISTFKCNSSVTPLHPVEARAKPKQILPSGFRDESFSNIPNKLMPPRFS